MDLPVCLVRRDYYDRKKHVTMFSAARNLATASDRRDDEAVWTHRIWDKIAFCEVIRIFIFKKK